MRAWKRWVAGAVLGGALSMACGGQPDPTEPMAPEVPRPPEPKVTEPDPRPDPKPLPKADLNTAPILEGKSAGWRFLGGPSRALGVSADAAGNLWAVAGDMQLYVLRKGAEQFETHVLPQNAIAVTGGPAGVAFVGYQGLDRCDSIFEHHQPVQQPGAHETAKTGDADRVELTAQGLVRHHYDISSPPGVDPEYPYGREKLCNVYRLAYDARRQLVWFGANHGVAVGEARTTRVIEHTHPAINGFRGDADTSVTILSGDYRGLAFDANGDLWMGGYERSAKGPNPEWLHFWTIDSYVNANKLDIWPDAVPDSSRPWQRVDDKVSALSPAPDGTVWFGSFLRGVAQLDTNGAVLGRYHTPLISSAVTAVAADPWDGSVWFGHASGGVTRLKDGQWVHYKASALGGAASSRVNDIQVDRSSDTRRVLFGFSSGIGIYTGE